MIVLCGDSDGTEQDLYSEEGEKLFSTYVKPVLGDKGVLFTWNTKHGEVHKEYMVNILQPRRPLPQLEEAKNDPLQPNDADAGFVDVRPDLTSKWVPDPYQSSSAGQAQQRSHNTAAKPRSNPGTEGCPIGLMMNTRLRNGEVSYHLGDVRFRYKGFQVPSSLSEPLRKIKGSTKSARVEIFRNKEGRLQAKVTTDGPFSGPVEEINEIQGQEAWQPPSHVEQWTFWPVLRTRLRHGWISQDPEDVEYWEEGFQPPTWLTEHLQQTKQEVESALVEISRDQRGELHPRVVTQESNRGVRAYISKAVSKVKDVLDSDWE